MTRHFLSGTLAAILIFLGMSRATAEPAAPEVLPAPRVESSPPVVYYSYPRVSSYEVWQNLAVGRLGQFRPVVIYSPYGAYYRYNLAPYPWTITHSWEFSPQKAVGSPNPSR